MWNGTNGLAHVNVTNATVATATNATITNWNVSRHQVSDTNFTECPAGSVEVTETREVIIEEYSRSEEELREEEELRTRIWSTKISHYEPAFGVSAVHSWTSDRDTPSYDLYHHAYPELAALAGCFYCDSGYHKDVPRIAGARSAAYTSAADRSSRWAATVEANAQVALAGASQSVGAAAGAIVSTDISLNSTAEFFRQGALYYEDSRPVLSLGDAVTHPLVGGSTQQLVAQVTPDWEPTTPSSAVIEAQPKLLDACVRCEALHEGMTSQLGNVQQRCQCSPTRGYLLETAPQYSAGFVARA